MPRHGTRHDGVKAPGADTIGRSTARIDRLARLTETIEACAWVTPERDESSAPIETPPDPGLHSCQHLRHVQRRQAPRRMERDLAGAVGRPGT
jgi:hypothetical protein